MTAQTMSFHYELACKGFFSIIAYKVLLTASQSHICFHQKSTTFSFVLKVTVIHFLYVQITYVNPLLSPDAYFVFSDYEQCFLLLYLLYYSTRTFAFVICSNKESSEQSGSESMIFCDVNCVQRYECIVKLLWSIFTQN